MIRLPPGYTSTDTLFPYTTLFRSGANLSQGAKLELVQPRDAATHEAKFLAAWGPGAYAVRISVNDLDAKADDLRSRGTRFEEEPATARDRKSTRLNSSH